jgi:hypothetical protein
VSVEEPAPDEEVEFGDDEPDDGVDVEDQPEPE